MVINPQWSGISNFTEYNNFVRPDSTGEFSFETQIAVLKHTRSFNIREKAERAGKTVVIAGSGPAGLLHAIAASICGYNVKVVEKRPEIRERRDQIVAIVNDDALKTLYSLGVIDYLASRNKILQPPRVTEENYGYTRSVRIEPLFVSIGDLEQALEEVLKGIYNGTSPIFHESRLSIEKQEDESFTVQISNGEIEETLRPDALFIAEGKKSEHAEAFGFKSVSILPPITMMVSTAAMHPFNEAERTWQQAIQHQLYVTGCRIYYFTCFIFESIGKFTRMTNSYQTSICFSTPETGYIGIAVHQNRLTYAKQLQAEIEELKKTPGNQPLIEQKTNELNGIISYWANVGYFAYNTLYLISRIASFLFGVRPIQLPPDYTPFQQGHLVEMETVKRELTSTENSDVKFVKIVGAADNKQIVGITGDTRFTIDFSTGKGVTNIIANFTYTHQFFESMGSEIERQQAIRNYDFHMTMQDSSALYDAERFREAFGA
jgi:hypothetical protein